MDIERRSTRSLPVENWLWKGLWTSRKADYRMEMVFFFRVSAYGFPPRLLDIIPGISSELLMINICVMNVKIEISNL